MTSQLLQYYKSFQNKPQNKQPTFEDLTTDDSLDEVSRIVKYTQSAIGLQRLVHVKMLADVASSISYHDMKTSILPLLSDLSLDAEPAVKQQLVEQLARLSNICISNGGEEGHNYVVETIIPLIGQLLEDEKAEVRQAATTTLVEIAYLLSNQQKGDEHLGQNHPLEVVLTMVLRLAHDDEREEMRMTAVELYNSLAECLGQDLCKQFIIPEVVSLAEDPVFRVRKATALNFHNICKVGGDDELFERLMPAFVRLTKDDMYRVRRACADSLYNIAQYVSDDIKIGVLVEIYLRFTQDPSRLVKQSILQQSGMFISVLPPIKVNEHILGYFCSMDKSPSGDLATDEDLRFHCAFTFPAVLKCIGKERWSEVREVYHSLVQCHAPKVRQTMAYSLHEIANLFEDVKHIEEELVPVFEELIQDEESVKMGIFKHLSEFLTLLSEPCRISYLPELHNILHNMNPFNWRLRETLAVQLISLLDLPPIDSVFVTLFPLVMTLFQDPVSSVRRGSYEGVAKMINMLSSLVADQEQLQKTRKYDAIEDSPVYQFETVCRAVNSLALGETFQHRQLWAELSCILLKRVPRNLFEKYFVDGLLMLGSDNVINVRLAVVNSLIGWAPDYDAPWEESPEEDHPWNWLLAREDMKSLVQRLAREDYDVYDQIIKLKPLFPDVQFERLSCRGMAEAPGGSDILMNSVTGLSAGEQFQAYYTSDERESMASDISSVDVIHIESGTSSNRLPPPAVSEGSDHKESTTVTTFEEEDDDPNATRGEGSNSPPLPPDFLHELEGELHSNTPDIIKEHQLQEDQSDEPEYMPVVLKDEDGNIIDSP